jgi:hypothetical protein
VVHVLSHMFMTAVECRPSQLIRAYTASDPTLDSNYQLPIVLFLINIQRPSSRFKLINTVLFAFHEVEK